VLLAAFLGVAPRVALAQSTVSIPLNLPDPSGPARAGADGIADLAVALVGSSSFNSAAHPDVLKQTVPDVQARYRQVVADTCLVLSYQTPVTIETMGGDVRVFEIVIGLGHTDRADAVFTIDESGRVVAHEKYSGYLAAKLREAADAAIGAR
jgi:hypothetical protein